MEEVIKRLTKKREGEVNCKLEYGCHIIVDSFSDDDIMLTIKSGKEEKSIVLNQEGLRELIKLILKTVK